MLFAIISATSFLMFNFQNCTKSEFTLRGGVTGLSGLNADDDSDGLSNSVEQTQGTNPEDKDTDGDGLLDGEEVNTHNTDPNNPDTDGGGVNDGDEVNNGTNPVDQPGDDTPVNPPVNSDNDNDGLTDEYENTVSATDPNNPDSDGDGLLDGEEVLGEDGIPNSGDETNPLDPCDPNIYGSLTADCDGDGISNGDEDINGNELVDADETDPENPDSDGDGLLDGEELLGPDGIADSGDESNPLDPCDPILQEEFGCIPDIMIPGGISPNGDGFGETWHIEGLEFYPEATVLIFNRWGNKVFEEKPFNNDWNGIGNENGADLLPTGTYFYIIDLDGDNSDNEEVINGFIYITRD